MHFENELPGYALDLATSIELVHWDTTRYMLYKKNLTKELLERQILKTMGIPELKKKILYIEKKVNDIDEEYVRIQLYKSLMLSVTRYCTGDWSKIKTNYSYVDKQFLNKQFTKYGKYHIKELLRTIYQMHMDELLPEILISIRNSFQNAKSEVNKFKKSIREQEAIVQLIILKSFITYSDKIKQDQELIEAYEDILEILINLNYEQAAVILDEFRIH